MTWKDSSNKVIDSFGWCTMHPKKSFKTKLQMSEFHFVALGWDPLYFSYVVLCTLKVLSTKSTNFIRIICTLIFWFHWKRGSTRILVRIYSLLQLTRAFSFTFVLSCNCKYHHGDFYLPCKKRLNWKRRHRQKEPGEPTVDQPPTKEAVVAKKTTTNEVAAAVKPIGVRLPKLIARGGGALGYRVPRMWVERKGSLGWGLEGARKGDLSKWTQCRWQTKGGSQSACSGWPGYWWCTNCTKKKAGGWWIGGLLWWLSWLVCYCRYQGQVCGREDHCAKRQMWDQ